MIRAFSQQIQMWTEGEAESRLEDILRQYDTRLHPSNDLNIPPGFNRASVLVPLFWKNGEWNVLLTVRSENLRSHSGLVAFPGGKEDPEDENVVATALRESEEEIGLDRKHVRVLCVLSPAIVRPANIVTPVVAIIPKDFEPIRNVEEVRKVFSLPISRFLNEDYTVKKFPFRGSLFFAYFFSDIIDGETIQTWGYTAQVIMKIAMVILDSDQQREVTEGHFMTKDTSLSAQTETDLLQQMLDNVKDSKL
ncbi:uncharacterized protein LOC110457489 isoform X2 [Mizuhopecten yessoensis]|uniref:Peroxisomal coenzyme A diphosphatase NUDT7 n=1 Tax=Mizuhopecten yessoensis TaxID=6573 RepID=A0A210Q8K8_MIZYE|nr:uncharacterized protein LOC110457489 isoform X2 [Mizuhopecten yessoensis]OWF45077.1 Peroxisomal coenzyme A diphosphatase NUDT7 [Mizuhopecten yessoensis]